MKLQDKVTLVTGASSGIGKATAIRFAEEGSSIAVFDIDEDGSHKVAREIRDTGRGVAVLKVDVADFSEAKKAVEKVIEEFQKIDILINNAGYFDPCPTIEMTEEIWNRMIGVTLNGTFNCTRWVLPHMLQQKRGRIINISSTAGISGSPPYVHYGAAKAGVINFTRALAKEVAASGITVNSVAPGPIQTRQLEKIPPDVAKQMDEMILVGRRGQPEDIANACLFLASDESSFITGIVLSPNGGFMITPM